MRRKMNFLIVMPKLAINTNLKYHFPLGIPYISAVMKQAGFNVSTYNPNHSDKTLTELLEDKLDNIDVVLTGGLSGQFYPIKNVLDVVKDFNSQIKIIVGGGLITANPIIGMQALEKADIGVIGEGEEVIVELCNALEEERDIKEVCDLVIKNGDTYVCTRERRRPVDIEKLPFPDYDGFDIETYLELTSQSIVGSSGERTFVMLSARSCPYNCSFCFHTVGKKYRVRTLESVFAEIDMLQEKYGITEIALSDELFAMDKDRVRIFAEFMKKKNMTWIAQFRIDQIDDELIDIIKNSTCRQMFFGIESVNDNILKSMKKHITSEMIEKNLKKVYDANIPFGGNLLFGDVEDTLETCLNNLKWRNEHPEYSIPLINIVCYPGSEIYKNAVARGITKDEIEHIKTGCPIKNISKMNDEEYAFLQIKLLEAEIGEFLEQQEITEFNSVTKTIKVKGVCKKCGNHIQSENILLFTTDYSYIYCDICGAKYRFAIPHKCYHNVMKNIKKLLDKHKKIIVWGVQPSTYQFFNTNDVFENDLITFMDTNEGRQLIKLTNKKKTIYSPQIMKTENFDYVVFCYPHLYANYARLMHDEYGYKIRFIDILDMVVDNDDFL